MVTMPLPEIQRHSDDAWFMNTKQGRNVENPIKTSTTDELRTVFRNLQRW